MLRQPTSTQLSPEDAHLWQHVQQCSISTCKLNAQSFQLVPQTEFTKLHPHFHAERLRRGHYRTRGAGTHLHAVVEPGGVNIHLDRHHPYTGPHRLFLHLLVDVIGTAIPTWRQYGYFALRPHFSRKSK